MKKTGIAYIGMTALFCGIFTVSGFGKEIITLTSYTNGVTVLADAAEYSRDEAGTVWDMNELRDIPFENGVLQPSVAGGIWSASSSESGASAGIYLLNGGIPNPPHKFHPTLISGVTPYGGIHPIEATEYYRLSLRMSMPQSQRGSAHFTWSHDPDVSPSSLGDTANVGQAALYDSRPTFNGATPLQVKYPSGFRIYDIDLTGTFDNGEYISWLSYPPQAPSGAGWSGDIYSLMIIPSTAQAAGTRFKIDWARLYNPDTATNLVITWTTTGVPSDNYHSIALYVDDDNSGYDGDLYASGIANDGSFVFNTGCLPPGSHYIYLKVLNHAGGGFIEEASSGYSSEIRIDAPPMLDFSAPSVTSGVDYATAELGNPWDMNNSSDVEDLHDIYGVAYQNGKLTGTMKTYTGASGNPIDPSIFLNTSKNGTHIPIDTTKYHYLTFRMSTDISQGNSLFGRMIRGWVAKLSWWKSSVEIDGTYSRDLHLYEGMRSYSMDLDDNDLANPNYSYDAGWEEIGQANVFRLDPAEADTALPFVLDDVKLCADNVPNAGRYVIKWNCTDADDANLTVSLYYGYETDLGYSEYTNPIAVLHQTPGVNQYVWDTSALASDRYYIRAEVTDGINTNSFMSQLPIVVDTGIPRLNLEGDDLAVFDTSDGTWYIAYADGGGSAIQWGWSSVEPVAGDYNGDGTNDLAVFDQATGRWFIRTVSGQTLAWSAFWGWPGVRPVPGDYNGDGTDDLAIFDQNTGRWFIRTLSGRILAWSSYWGWPGVEPVPGDYDGDGIDDLAIFDQNTGRWFIRTMAGRILVWERWWGFAGCTPVPGDYDNDGVADKAVYYEPSGMWYFNFSSGKADEVVGPWRGPGSIPVPGNFDGK